MSRIILGIETSCDDTSVCLLREVANALPEILSHRSFSQETILKKWGGVVPEIAARNHLIKLQPLLEECFNEAKLSAKEISLIGVTTHPGLLGPLLTGINAAKTMSLINHTSILAVNHLYAHLEAIHLTGKIQYPYLGLLVSGGHSLFALVRDPYTFEVLGSTIDDAAGEAFDKGAKLLGLGYPGGKIIDELAQKGDVNKYQFPIGLKSSADCNLSYSGVKTALRDFIEKNKLFAIEDVCASYQHAIVEAILLKMRYAIEKTKLKFKGEIHIVVGGGVAANSYLRKRLSEKYKNTHFVKPAYCTDNGAMIANYTLRTSYRNSVSYPNSLLIDAHGKFIDKEKLRSDE